MITKYSNYIKENLLDKALDGMYKMLFKKEYDHSLKLFEQLIDKFNEIFSEYTKYGYKIKTEIEKFNTTYNVFSFNISIFYKDNIIDIVNLEYNVDIHDIENSIKINIFVYKQGDEFKKNVESIKNGKDCINCLKFIKDKLSDNDYIFHLYEKTKSLETMLLTEEQYDLLVDKMLLNNLQNISKVDLDRCSNIMKNKWIHLKNANNFDLI